MVGVGASAGGLEAFTQLLIALPGDTGMAFVLVQHLDPKHDSLLSDILSRATKMPVQQATEGVAIEPNHVYVIPPNVDMAVRADTLHLMARRKARGPHLPIDRFFRSLAEEKRSQAIGVILSGTASDGSHGMTAIKAAGGLTFAQDEKSAKFGSMPHSAVAAGAVDFVLPPAQIAVELARIGRHPYVLAARDSEEELAEDNAGTLNKILQQLRIANGVNFALYKQSTVKRRIKRRMVVHSLERLDDYLKFLGSHPAEMRALYDDMLINVTGFFRDPPLFDTLKDVVLPAVCRDRAGSFRAWVPGCATGEEAYSIAICLIEYLGDRLARFPVQVFGTDISETAIEKARAGIYRDTIESDVSPERMRRFFVRTDGRYQISKAVRDLCVFARQDVTRDPPFSKLDLVSCRNVLIYLGPLLQKQVIPIFHYALKPTGYLMLGSSEALTGFSDLFKVVGKKGRIYAKKTISGRAGLELRPSHASGDGRKPAQAPFPHPPLPNLNQEADRILLSRYAPPGVLVSDEFDIVQFRGRMGPYLEPAPGQASLNVLRMAREGLGMELRATLHRAKQTHRPVRREDVQYRQDGQARRVTIDVLPFVLTDSVQQYFYLVLFSEPSAPARRPAKGSLRSAPLRESAEVASLKRELASKRGQLQSIIEEQDATNEELQSVNEEALSTNEELQSTNEELTTAKEELQSANEELTTVNEEVQQRNVELGQLNNDLSNVLASVNVPIVIVGSDLRIRRFTPSAERVLNLIRSDIGRRITDIRPNIHLPELEPLLLEVLDTISPRETTVRDSEGRLHSLRLRPYRTLDNRIDGAVIMLMDIHQLMQTMQRLNQFEDYADAIIEMVQEAIVVLNNDLRVQKANRAFYELFRTTAELTVDHRIDELWREQWNISTMVEPLRQVSSGDAAVAELEVEADFPFIGRKSLVLSVRRLQDNAPPEFQMCAVIADVTSHKQAEKTVDELSSRLLNLRDEEQRRIARELHDSTAQNISALAMNLALATQADCPPRAQQILSDSIQLAEQSARELRDMAALLHPPLLDEVGFVEALKGFVESFQRRTGIQVTFHAGNGAPDLSKETATALFRIVQESLTNIQKHSGSRSAEIWMYPRPREIEIRVEDHGGGVPKAISRGDPSRLYGVGIPGMRQRVKQLDGEFRIRSSPNGTTIEVVIPLPPPPPAAGVTDEPST